MKVGIIGSGDVAKAVNFTDAAKFGDLLVLAVKGSAALEALKIAGASNVSGKTVIDATNPIADSQPENVERCYPGGPG